MSGLREAHAHVFAHGRALDMVDLSGCRSSAEMMDALAERARRPGDILAHGARPEAWSEARWPTLEQIEHVAGGRLLAAWCFDYHALIASRAALAAAGLGDESPDPPGGIIGRDADGSITGVVYEHAASLVWQALPEPGADERRRCVRRSVEALSALGYTEVHDLKAPTWLGPVLAELCQERSEECFVIWPLLDNLEEVLATRGAWESGRVRLGGAKIFVDGTLNSRTAWMLRPFADGRREHPCGTPMMTHEQIEAAVRRCDEAGVPLAAHAIGDGAVRAVLDAIETVRPRVGGFRVEHCELIDEADVARFAALGVIASVQPCHLLYDIEALRRGLPDRLDRVMPLRDLIDSGLKPGAGLIFGSDVPIVRADAGDSVQAAVHRRRVEMGLDEAVGAEQAISEAEALRCFSC